MPLLRTTFFFKSDTGYGWTETFFSTRAVLNTALQDAIFILPKRLQLLGSGVSCVFIRVSDDLVKRDSEIYQVPASDQKPTGLVSGASDIPNTCVIVRLEGSPVRRRTLYMRGVPDAIVINAGRFDPDPTWVRNFGLWSALLTAGAWAMKCKSTPGAFADINGVSTPSGNGTVTISTGLPHGFVQGDIVGITGVKGASAVNGKWTATTVPSATTFTIIVNRIPKPYTVGGKTAKYESELVGIVSAQTIRASHRIAGRPFDAPRGRRLVR